MKKSEAPHDYSKPYPGHKLGKPAGVPLREWKTHYFENPTRDWPQSSLQRFIDDPQGESTEHARAQLAFLKKYRLNQR